MKKIIVASIVILAVIFSLHSCSKDKKAAKKADSDLYDAIGESGFTYYVGTPGITAALGSSPHGFERIRFNSIAQAALDTAGKLPVGGSFPDGSIIVKDIYTSATGSISLYAVMKKSSSSLAGSGYEWAEFEPDGKVKFSTSKKGDGCISCHTTSPNRDLTKIFDLH